MTAVEVLACECCLIRPAVVYDTHADVVACRVCRPDDPPNAYDMEFVLSCIPADLKPTYPARPAMLWESGA